MIDMIEELFDLAINLLCSKSFWWHVLCFAAIVIAMRYVESVRDDIAAARHHLKSIDDQLSKRL